MYYKTERHDGKGHTYLDQAVMHKMCTPVYITVFKQKSKYWWWKYTNIQTFSHLHSSWHWNAVLLDEADWYLAQYCNSMAAHVPVTAAGNTDIKIYQPLTALFLRQKSVQQLFLMSIKMRAANSNSYLCIIRQFYKGNTVTVYLRIRSRKSEDKPPLCHTPSCCGA
jgi:hypothetical protein